jgi:NAD dependent epimerase/dehydratase family enzyme
MCRPDHFSGAIVLIVRKERSIHYLGNVMTISFGDALFATKSLSEVINVTAPTPVPNKQFMSSLRSALKAPIGIALPKWLLELGAVVVGTETELVLKSRQVIPRKFLDTSYRFKYYEVSKALNYLV